MRIIPDTEAIRYILQQQRRYICYLGAGASSEAGVMTAQKICDDIRGKLQPPRLSDKKADQWARERLNWDIPSRRYSTCMRAYGDVTKRLWMSHEEFERVTRAVVSPEDTCISAGGGVAYLLLEKAGKYAILNELSKFSSLSEDGQSPVERGKVAVTSCASVYSANSPRAFQYSSRPASREVFGPGQNWLAVCLGLSAAVAGRSSL